MRVRLRKWEEIRPVRGNAEVLLQMWAENQRGVCINSKGNVHILYAFKDDFSVWSYCYSAYSGLKRGSKQVTRQATKTWLSGIFYGKSSWFWVGLTLCFWNYCSWEYGISELFAQPKKDEWTDQLLLWLHWISVAAANQLQPMQKGLANRRLGATLRTLHCSRRCLLYFGDPWSGEGSGKAGTALMPHFSLERMGLSAPSLPLPNDHTRAEAELAKTR